MNNQFQRIIKEHELQQPTLDWCPVCGIWQTITIQGFHNCHPSVTTLIKPWRILDEKQETSSETVLPSSES